ncbi:MAG: hypothetical protein JKY17_06840 [Magnetovibrio sp.]|nr:hypothetical protein [Magnetovibrio sp.]
MKNILANMKRIQMKKIPIIVVCAIFAMGFTAALAQTEYGQGTLTVAPSVNAKYQKYLQLQDPLAFAVSTDGLASSGSFCQVQGNCPNINGPQIALNQCNAASAPKAPCRLFAIGRDVVWYGRISLKSDIGSGPITLSVAVEQKFQTYSSLTEPLAFAVSTDGQRASGSFCQRPGTCQDIDGPGLALQQCHATGGPKDHPCKLFAIGQDIVWDGTVTLSTPQLQTTVTSPSIATAPQLRQAAPVQASLPKVSIPNRVRFSKAFRDLEEEIRNTQQTLPPATPPTALAPSDPIAP